MSDSTVIRNARLSQRPGRYQLLIAAGRVQCMESMTHGHSDFSELSDDFSTKIIDFEGDWLSLGAVDLQINGALGLAFPDLRTAHLDQLQIICEWLWQQGIDGFCPTLVTTSVENFQGSLAAIRAFQSQQARQSSFNSAKILGVHLEGPFLNKAKRGAHPAEFLQRLTLQNIKAVIGEFVDIVSIVTLAPELEETPHETRSTVIRWLREQGIVVSLGHSLATAAQTNWAFKQGATMVTHAFNAMPGLHHREPGLLGAALSNPRVSCGFIADGQHVCPTMLDLLLRLGRGRFEAASTSDLPLSGLFLVSDALSPLGLPDGTYPWDARQIEVVQGTARLADGTLSGTTLPLITGALNLVKWRLCGVDDAIALITQAPRQAIGLPMLASGSPASLLRWHQDTPTQQLTWQRLNCT